jgi:hypothetical protein
LTPDQLKEARRKPGFSPTDEENRMAASPYWKLYRQGEYVGGMKYAEDAAAACAIGVADQVRADHRKAVWREGEEKIPAADSYDRAALVMMNRAQRS